MVRPKVLLAFILAVTFGCALEGDLPCQRVSVVVAPVAGDTSGISGHVMGQGGH